MFLLFFCLLFFRIWRVSFDVHWVFIHWLLHRPLGLQVDGSSPGRTWEKNAAPLGGDKSTVSKIAGWWMLISPFIIHYKWSFSIAMLNYQRVGGCWFPLYRLDIYRFWLIPQTQKSPALSWRNCQEPHRPRSRSIWLKTTSVWISTSICSLCTMAPARGAAYLTMLAGSWYPLQTVVWLGLVSFVYIHVYTVYTAVLWSSKCTVHLIIDSESAAEATESAKRRGTQGSCVWCMT